MERSLVEQKIRSIIADELGTEESEVTPMSQIMDDLGADSLDVTEIVMRCEDEFDILIPEDDADRSATVQHLIDVVYAAKLRKK